MPNIFLSAVIDLIDLAWQKPVSLIILIGYLPNHFFLLVNSIIFLAIGCYFLFLIKRLLMVKSPSTWSDSMSVHSPFASK